MAIESTISVKLETTNPEVVQKISDAIEAMLLIQDLPFTINETIPKLVDLSASDEQIILTWFHEVGYIVTIKRIRTSFGCSLYNAKQTLDNLLADYRIERHNSPFKRNAGPCSECGKATYYYLDENVLFHDDFTEVRDYCPSAKLPVGVR